MAQLFNEFLTSFEVGGFEGVRGLGEAIRATAAGAAGLFAGVVAVAAKDVPAKIKSMRVSGCILGSSFEARESYKVATVLSL